MLLARMLEGNIRFNKATEEAIIVVGGTGEAKTTLVCLMIGLNISAHYD
jgi:Flp pilus assembly CpaF family ATPase